MRTLRCNRTARSERLKVCVYNFLGRGPIACFALALLASQLGSPLSSCRRHEYCDGVPVGSDSLRFAEASTLALT
jgi:hypothetical protein